MTLGVTGKTPSAPERPRPGPQLLCGLLAHRPAIGFTDEAYFALDTHQIFFGTGAGWSEFVPGGSGSGLSFMTLTPPTITSDQNDYAPTDGATKRYWRLASDAARTITGIGSGTDGEMRRITNVGSFDITFADQNAGSSAANRIITGLFADLILPSDTTIAFIYDPVTQRWRRA